MNHQFLVRLLWLLMVVSPLSSQDDDDGMQWIALHDLTVEGQGWSDVESPFDRLPARAKGVVRGVVWALSQDSAGICARFTTDATEIHCRWGLRSSELAMPHMPATGVSGVDLFVRGSEGRWLWLACPRPDKQEMEATLITDIDPGLREYMLYLPLYNGVSHCEIGVPSGRKLAPGPDRPEGQRKPILFYGTSITHGACASRPGACHTALLGRRFDRPVINLGLSGNGRMEASVGQFLCELDPAVFVVDCLPNMNGGMVTERLEALVHQLRKARPLTPILLVEDRTFGNAFLHPKRRLHHQASRKALREGLERLRGQGVKGLILVEGATLLVNGDTVDGSHPSDLGFVHQAEVLGAALEPLLRTDKSR
ncbi:MAG TPA: hypothetical protein EYQ25_04125 [Planctomycetes bacterium]|nr:hypothetical protein [Planctomycetota bacterium]HIL37493.1 hypothetical protein [Planctomycetota bacterium]